MRRDATQNRELVLEVAGRLLDAAEEPSTVSIDAIASAAGVGKGTVFRGFGSRSGLVVELFERRVRDLLERLGSEDRARTPADRVLRVLLALVDFKQDNRVLAAAIESSDGNPYHQSFYLQWHAFLRQSLIEARGPANADFLAHALLSSVRSDLLGLLDDWPRRHLRAGLEALVVAVVGEVPECDYEQSERI